MSHDNNDSRTSRKRRRLNATDYTVACLVALEVELTPMRAVLDAIHDVPDLHYTSSSIAYTCGEIGIHNVVLAILPRIGSNDSGVAANQLKNDFPSIHYGLLVGIAGGVPDPQLSLDIRLGDVVISDWNDNIAGVVQLDRGKHLVDGFVRTGHLNHPPNLLMTTLRNMQSEARQQSIDIRSMVDDMLRRTPALSQDYSMPDPESDQLYDAEYHHVVGTACENCDKARIVARIPRVKIQPEIHYGTIGSFNSVLRNGLEREKLREAIPRLAAVEMEAAGLMNYLPCVVIKGVCDYADSHKDENKLWQPYAAAVAAACAKFFLKIMPGRDPTGSEGLQASESSKMAAHDAEVSSIPHVATGSEPDFLEILIDSLTFNRMDARLRNVGDALPKTCKWILRLPIFRKWCKRQDCARNKGFLWIKGKPGCGKSTIMKATHGWAKRTWRTEVIISYFFNARAPGQLEKSSIGLYRSITYQLLQAIPSLRTLFLEHFGTKHRGDETEDWTKEELQGFWRAAIETPGNSSINIFIDALDEGHIQDIRLMVSFLEDLTEVAYEKKCKLRICLSSRHYPQIGLRSCLSLVMEEEKGHGQDIGTFVDARLRTDSPGEAQALKEHICTMSQRVFLWVVLVIPILNDATLSGRPDERHKCLRDLPKDLEGLFGRVLARNDVGISQTSVFLRWVLFAQEPLSQAEIYLATATSAAILDHQADRPINVELPSQAMLDRFVLDNSRGLAELTKSSPPVVQFIHETVRTFLLERGLQQLCLEDTIDAEGKSHDLFAQTCFRYVEDHAIEVGKALKAKSNGQLRTNSSTSRLSKPSLIIYATTYLFAHCEIAQQMGISQADFLDELERDLQAKLAAWVKCRNRLQKFLVREYKKCPPLLYIFAEQNLPHLCALRLTSGEHDEMTEERYGTALQAACFHGHREIVRLLITSGSDVNRAGGEYHHCLFATLFGKNYGLAELLIIHGARPDKASLAPRLFTMIARKNLEAIKILLRLGASVSATRLYDYHQVSILTYAISHRVSLEIIHVLLDSGVDINAHGGRYGTALQTACEYGQIEIARLLIDSGADVNTRAGHCGTALQAACTYGITELVRLLLDSRADVNAQAGYYGTALQAAAHNGRRKAILALLKFGAETGTQPCGVYGTPLIAASTSGHDDVLKLLLEIGADVNAWSPEHGSALYALDSAVLRFGSVPKGHIAQLLKAYGARKIDRTGAYVD